MSFRGSSRGRGGRGGGRGGRGGFGGPKLPAALLDQVDAKYGSGGKREMSRKEKRKADRHDRRGPPQTQSRAGRYEPSDGDDDGEADDQPPTKKAKTATPAKVVAKSTKGSKEEPKKKKLPELTLPTDNDGDVEDREIEWLEFMLKKGGKGKGKAPDEDDLDDGLDDLLDFAGTLERGGLRPGQEASEDYGEGEVSSEGGESDGELDDDESEEDAEEDGEVEEDPDDRGDEEVPTTENEEPFMGFSDDEGDETVKSDQGEVSEINPSASLDTSDQTTPGAPTKYVPPHLRAKMLEEKALGSKEKAEEKMRLERKAQGLLNKLSEQNIESIMTEIETLYRNYSRHDVTTTLTELIIQMIANKANLLDSFVVLYATLAGTLHRIVGMEFGAHFVHTLVMRYTSSTSSSSMGSSSIQATIYETPDAGKEGLNLLTLIAELYNAQVVGSRLIYDLIRNFLESKGPANEIMGEKEVEALLKILRCSGTQLRLDDPASLKDIVNLVQEKTKGKEKSMTARARFMVETLTNVKNGKVKSSAASEAGNDAAGRMKKFLAGLGRKRRLMTYEPLRAPLQDLLNADKKGKWWLVGAGWSGNPLVDLKEQKAIQPLETQSSSKKKTKEVDAEAALLDLARKQGMNTDVRRGIFVVLMTSEDYVHACDRLSMFKLSDVQQREFVRVALHCCGLEKTYNPYYTLILSKLTSESYDHRFTLQYALWDFMRQLEDGEKVAEQKIVNIARAIGYVVARGGLELSIFKAVDFTSLSKTLIKFLTTTLPVLLISLQTPSPIFTLPKSYSPSDFDDEVIIEKFEKCLSNTELAGGWLWVIDRQMGKSGWDEGLGEREKALVQKSIAIAKGVLGGAIA